MTLAAPLSSVNKLKRLGIERERSLLSPQSLVPPVGLEPTLSAF
jgi:hypothetical protein